jgi:uncharacterized cupin superfamily protein
VANEFEVLYRAGMPKIDPSAVTTREGSTYPSPFDEPCRERRVGRLGDAAGLTQFGANLVELAPGAWASQRHWHACEDEFVYLLEGELTLIEDAGETALVAGDSAGWPAGVRDGHHLVNTSTRPARFLVIGTRDDSDHGEYSDIDMKFGKERYAGKGVYRHKDGTPY